MKYKFAAIFLIGLFFLITPFFTNAAHNAGNCAVDAKGKLELPDKSIEVKVSIPSVTHTCTLSGSKVYYVDNLNAFAAAMYKFLIGLAGIAAVIAMMVGGYLWLFSGGNASRVGEAKSIIGSAVLGLFLTIGSFMILNLINPDLVNWRFDPSKIEEVGSIASTGKVKRICSAENRKEIITNKKINPLDFQCGSTYYPDFDKYQQEIQINCAKGKEKTEACTNAKAKMQANGCMDVVCRTDYICGIETEGGYYIGGRCEKTLKIVNKATGASESVSVKDLNGYCGIAAVEASLNRISSSCYEDETISYPEYNNIKLNTCTIFSEKGKGFVYKPNSEGVENKWFKKAIDLFGALGNATGVVYGLNPKGEITLLTSPSCYDLRALAN